MIRNILTERGVDYRIVIVQKSNVTCTRPLINFNSIRVSSILLDSRLGNKCAYTLSVRTLECEVQGSRDPAISTFCSFLIPIWLSPRRFENKAVPINPRTITERKIFTINTKHWHFISVCTSLYSIRTPWFDDLLDMPGLACPHEMVSFPSHTKEGEHIM